MKQLFGVNFESSEYDINRGDSIIPGSHVTDHTADKNSYSNIKYIIDNEFDECTIGWIAEVTDPTDISKTIRVKATPIFHNNSQVYWLGYNDTYGYVVVSGSDLTYLGLAYIELFWDEQE